MATTPRNSPQQSGERYKSEQHGSEFESDASGVKRTLQHEADDAKGAMHDARDAVTGKASQFASEAKRSAMNSAEGAKRHASESLRTFAETVREAGDKLSDDDQGMAAGFVRQAASGLERLSTSLGEKRFGEMVEDVRNFGRTNPTAFIAGSVLAGLAIGRFVRSTATHDDDGYGQSQGMASQGGIRGSRGGSASTGAAGGMTATGGSGSRSRVASSLSTGSTGSSFGAPIGGAVTKGPGSPSTSSASGASSFGSPGVADQTRGISGGAGRGDGAKPSGTGRVK